MINRIQLWWIALDSGWKTFMSAMAIVGAISTAAIKINKGVEAMTKTANNVELLMKSDTLKMKKIDDLTDKTKKYFESSEITNKFFEEHLEKEKKVDELIRLLKARNQVDLMMINEKKNLTP